MHIGRESSYWEFCLILMVLDSSDFWKISSILIHLLLIQHLIWLSLFLLVVSNKKEISLMLLHSFFQLDQLSIILLLHLRDFFSPCSWTFLFVVLSISCHLGQLPLVWFHFDQRYLKLLMTDHWAFSILTGPIYILGHCRYLSWCAQKVCYLWNHYAPHLLCF